MKNTEITFVAHRGYQARYPENTLLAINAAYEAGIKHIELDIQLSSDHYPVVYHDETLDRLSGVNGFVHQYPLNDLKRMPASEPNRLGDQFSNETISSLADIALWASKRPDATLYIEVKPEILAHANLDITVKAVAIALEAILTQCIIISFSLDILAAWSKHVRTHYPSQPVSTGLVIDHWDEFKSGRVDQFIEQEQSVVLLFCNHEMVPDDFDFQSHRLPWVLFEVGDIKTVQKFNNLGCTGFESFIAPELVKELS